MAEDRTAMWQEQFTDDRHLEMRRLADQCRQVIEHLVATAAPLDVLRTAAGHLEEVVRLLEGYPHGRLYEGFAETPLSGNPKAFFEHSPVMGMANPLAPPLRLEIVDGHVEGTAVFGSAYEGPPDSVHGGYVACAFDEVLGMAQSLGGNPGMTGTLTIKYRKPTPLHRELRFEGRLDRVDGRKTFASGTCHDGDTLTAEAEGLFISVDFSKIAAMMEKRNES
jgi:acyl-coenzyme A thioesterase PaaI-like protein